MLRRIVAFLAARLVWWATRCFPPRIIAGGLNEHGGEPNPHEPRWFGWQLHKLGFELRQADSELPASLQPTPRRQWEAEECQRFDDWLHRNGKRFRQMAPLFPRRSLAELVEHYYATKAHKRLRQISSAQAAKNIRQRPCGTIDCLLHDNHAGPHMFAQPVGPRVRKRKFQHER